MLNLNGSAESAVADLVLRGGAVHVLDAAGARAEAVAVVGGRIARVGSESEIEGWIGERTRVVELRGRAVIPGINDSHLHAAWLGARWPHTFFGAADPEAASRVSGALVTSREERRAAILRAGSLLAELGITSYTEPGIGPGEDEGETGCFTSDVLEAYRELAAEGALRQRVTMLALYGILDGPSELGVVLAGIAERAEAPAEPDPRWLNLTGVKIFGDLIPMTRQAWTEHSYDDGSHGALLVEGDSIEDRAANLAAMVRATHLAGLQLGVHATGDRTIQLVLDALAAAEAEAGPEAGSVRELAHYVIHGDLATEAQLRRMGELGVRLNTQSGIAALTADWLAGVLGAAAAEAWRIETALDAGVLVLSSDSPVLGFDWRRGIADAEARIVHAGGADDEASKRRRLHGLLRAYTAVAAEQDRAAAWKGTVEAGKAADLLVLARDPYEVGAAGLPEVEVDLTVLDGRVVFERGV